MSGIQVSTAPVAKLTPLVRQPVGQSPAAAPAGTLRPLLRDGVSLRGAQGGIPATGVGLDLMTYNVWGLPGPLGERQKERMQQIGTAVRGHGIVALQETFTRHAGAIGKLAGYAHETKGSDGGPFKLKSGLTTLTNYEVLETDFAPFKKAGHADRLAAKGVLFTRVNVPGVGPVDIYNTHYQAQRGYEAIRQHDNEVMAAFVMRHEAGNPTFIMGDFNFTSQTKEYQRLVNGLGLRDAFAEANPGVPGYTSSGENTNKKPSKSGNRIDYIFVKGNSRFDIDVATVDRAMTQTFNGKHASDHFAVHGRFVIRPKAAAAAPVPPN